jgi:hypothetical protein
MTMDEIVHACPLPGSGRTPCCDRTPFELEHTDRLTLDPLLVTCPERRHQYVTGTAAEDIPAGAAVILEVGGQLVGVRH